MSGSVVGGCRVLRAKLRESRVGEKRRLGASADAGRVHRACIALRPSAEYPTNAGKRISEEK